MLQVLRKLNLDQKKFIILCIVFSFLITLDYSCLRPAAHSMFITQFGAKMLPWVWLVSLPVNFTLVALFNKLQSSLGSKKLNVIFPIVVMLLNAGLTVLLKIDPKISFVFFLWKDLYILLMFQQLWSQIHASIGQSQGRSLYGAMYAFGALGSLVGTSIPALLKLQTPNYLFCTLFVYPLILLVQSLLLKNKIHVSLEKKKRSSAIDGIRQIIANKPLITIGVLVALMQMVSALSEFNFSYHLETSYKDLESRTKASAYVMSLMHFLTLGLQFLFMLVPIDKLGIKRGHKLIPSLIFTCTLGYLLVPGFKTASLGFSCAKSLDFSLFSVLKETLYAPLDKALKYEAKSFIDIFVYRGAKTVMSLTLIAFGTLHSSLFFGLLLLGLACIWFLVAQRRLGSYQLEA